jgi:Bacterial PH domain
MSDVYAFEPCPFRDAAHAVADRSSIARSAARVLWPATRGERVEISDEGIEAWTLTGTTRLDWDDVTAVEVARSPLGRRMLRIRGTAGRIDVVGILPGFEALESRVLAARPVLATA